MSGKLKTVNIKGKEYVTVNERIRAFWEQYPTGRIITKVVANDDGFIVMTAEIYTDREDTIPATIGYAYERENSSPINKRFIH